MKTAAITQARVIGALILRETRVRYGRSQFGYLWALGEPVAYVTAFSAMFTFTGSHAPFGNSMALFYALGILPFTLYRNLGNQLMMAFESNEALLSFPIVKELDTVVARAILEAATMLVVMTLILSTIVTLGDAPLPGNPVKMAIALLGLVMLGFGIGLINAVLVAKFKSWQNIYTMTALPLLLTSGVFYSLESLPTKVSSFLSWNPIIHGVEGMRDGYYLNYRAGAVDISYLFWWGLIATLIGLAAERAIRIRPI